MNKMTYRLLQFYRALWPSVDRQALQRFQPLLSARQWDAFFAMELADQAHALQVALYCEELLNNQADANKKLLMQAALLHDIGKAQAPLNVWVRSLYVLLERWRPGFCRQLKPKNWPFFMQPFLCALHVLACHAKLGAQQARQSGWQLELVQLIAVHHQKDLCHSTEARLLYRADSAC